jgi:L-ascorbate metabolism protein UlaG (beta-lactamase superfamily)
VLSLKLTWLGHASFKLETSNGKISYLDPWIEGNPACPIRIADVTKADIVFVTHGHIDRGFGLTSKSSSFLSLAI